MNRLAWFLLGVLSLAIVQGAALVIWVTRAHGLSASATPGSLERWMARRARDAAIPTEAKNQKNLVPNTVEVLIEARAHWADHCAICHGNDGSGDTFIGKHIYPPAPDMRAAATQNLSDGELFYVIQNGIRLTAMPAWAGSEHDAEDSWKLVRFIRHLPRLTIEERKEMEKLNPKSPEELKEEEEEEKFLKGEDIHEATEHHHH